MYVCMYVCTQGLGLPGIAPGSTPPHRSLGAAIPPASPPWHRRLRQHRASARRRLRLGIPSRRDLLVLGFHHGTAPQQRKELQTRFPAYHQTKVDDVAVPPAQEEDLYPAWVERGAPTNYMRDLQRALTQCRKAEGRLRRLQEARGLKERQWQQYQRELKTAFLDQKQKRLYTNQGLAEPREAAGSCSFGEQTGCGPCPEHGGWHFAGACAHANRTVYPGGGRCLGSVHWCQCLPCRANSLRTLC